MALAIVAHCAACASHAYSTANNADASATDVAMAVDARDASTPVDVTDVPVVPTDVVDVPVVPGDVPVVTDVVDAGIPPVDVPVVTDVPMTMAPGFSGAFVGAAATGTTGSVQLRGVMTWHAGVRATTGAITLEGWFR